MLGKLGEKAQFICLGKLGEKAQFICKDEHFRSILRHAFAMFSR